VIRRALQAAAFFLPPPLNAWAHRLAGAHIARGVFLHPCVLILAREVRIERGARVRFGTFISVRSFRLGQNSRMGYFTIAKGVSDLHIGDACILGPKLLLNCERPIVLDYYCGVGTGSMLYTHGCFLPVTEGARATFAPIHMRPKSWITVGCIVGPGVTIGENSVVMPGSVVLSDVAPNMLVSNRDVRMREIPRILDPRAGDGLEAIAKRIFSAHADWSREYAAAPSTLEGDALRLTDGRRDYRVTIDDGGDITLLTRPGAAARGMWFNLADLTTDSSRHPVKAEFEDYLGRNHGLIFVCRPD